MDKKHIDKMEKFVKENRKEIKYVMDKMNDLESKFRDDDWKHWDEFLFFRDVDNDLNQAKIDNLFNEKITIEDEIEEAKRKIGRE